MQIYVNQHDFFISKDRIIEEAEKQDFDGADGDSERPKRADMYVME